MLTRVECFECFHVDWVVRLPQQETGNAVRDVLTVRSGP